MPFFIPKRLALFGFLAVSGVLITGCSTSKDDAKHNDNRLVSLSVSAGALTPAFSSTTDSYRLTVDGTVSATTVTAVLSDFRSSMTINGVAMASNTPTASIPVPVGVTNIPVVVTAEDGTTHTYSVAITKVISSDTTLSSINLSRGTLAPAFTSSQHAFNVTYVSNPTDITLAATPTHPRAHVKINGVAVVNGAATTIPLDPGVSKVTIDVTAEDGHTASNVVSIKKFEPTTEAWVLDSVNGSPLPSALITVQDEDGAIVENAIPVDPTGKATLGLDLMARYTILAQGAGSAQAALVNFDPYKETRADLYCHSLGMINFPASAPVITEVSYSPTGEFWTPIKGNACADILANMKYLMVTAIGRSGISATAWSGFGIGINIDQKAWISSKITPLGDVENSTPVTVNGLPYYQTTTIFPIQMNNSVAGGAHTINVVVYDVANNRTEQNIYATVVDAVTNLTDPNISTVMPVISIVQLQTHGLSRDTFALDPQGNPNSYTALVQFYVGSGVTAPGIRGFELYRSEDGGTFTKVATQNYATLTSGTNGLYQVLDIDPTLREGVTYSYKVKAFNRNLTANSGYTLESAPVPSKFLSAFTTTLAAPAMNAVTMTRKPDFTFNISTPALFDAAVSDYFRFYLYVKDKLGTVIYAQYYRYNFITSKFEKSIGGVWNDATADCTISEDHTSVTIKYPNATTLMPGITYEWTIFGTSATTASSFYRYTPGTSNTGTAVSFGSTYEKSYGAINGFFTLTIDPSAE